MKLWDIFYNEEHLYDLLESKPDYSGQSAGVYNLNDCVLKVFKSGRGYLTFLEFIKACSSSSMHDINRHLPKIHDHIIYEDLHLVLMEKLSPIQDEEIISRQDKAECQGWYDMDIQPWLGISKSFDKVLYELEEFGGLALENLYIDWDLHCGNIMERNGVLVVIDPWC